MCWPAGKGNEAPWDWLAGWRAVYRPTAGEAGVYDAARFARLADYAEGIRGGHRASGDGLHFPLHFPLDTSDSETVGSPAT